jgi:ATP-binding cassette subfamily E protein 1
MESETRLAIVAKDKCKPKQCKQECKRKCPSNIMGKLCIEILPTEKTAIINESLCIGCGICVKQCPFGAIQIIKIPTNIDKDIIHRYGPNQFKLHRLPIPRSNEVLGLCASNGLGKSTVLKILAGKLIPNFGDSARKLDKSEISSHFKGSELQSYFEKVYHDEIKPIIKPQFVDQISNIFKGTVNEALTLKNQKGSLTNIINDLDLTNILNHNIPTLSGGELQRFAIALTCIQNTNVYMFDEPTSYLDIKQRINAATTIRSLITSNINETQKYVIVVEHDLSILDYLSDYICLLYGTPGAYGVVTLPFSTRVAINIFLDGYIPAENMRFRDEPLKFKITDNTDDSNHKKCMRHSYPNMEYSIGNFKLNIESGEFTESEIILALAQNGCGKTILMKLLAGIAKPNNVEMTKFNVSFKPQHITPRYEGTVRSLLFEKLSTLWQHPQFLSDVIKPLQIDKLFDNKVKTLSGGELQRVAITLCLGKPANIYIIDEPSAYLDSEQRVIAARVIKRFIMNSKKTSFIVEHDFIMATYLADKVIVYTGQPSIECTALKPQPLLSGMNLFLEQLNVTFRRDPTNYRPRINKLDSVKDREQKLSGQYFHYDPNDQ